MNYNLYIALKIGNSPPRDLLDDYFNARTHPNATCRYERKIEFDMTYVVKSLRNFYSVDLTLKAQLI